MGLLNDTNHHLLTTGRDRKGHGLEKKNQKSTEAQVRTKDLGGRVPLGFEVEVVLMENQLLDSR